MVRSRSVDWLRREARHQHSVEIDEAPARWLEAEERTDQQVAVLEERRHARQPLVGLPTEQRRVIELAYFKGLTQTEIAAKLAIPLGTVKGRQRLAITKMRQQLTGLPEAAPSFAFKGSV
jgi:RNA polymerase sigma-70 factor, ECF subfamily